MRIAFVSTILSFPWGGADTLWTRATEAAAARGDRLMLSLSALTAGHERIKTLVAGGAELHLRAPLPPFPPFTARLKRKLGLSVRPDSRLIAWLSAFSPDLVVFSQGGTYDLLQHRDLVGWLLENNIPFRLIANWQTEHPVLFDADLAFIRTTFAAADRLDFVSTRNLAVTRRHLLAPLANARVLHNPLRWQPADTSPWPAAAEARLATVSRLDPGKGIHLLLHALAEAAADLPPWRLEIFGQGPQETLLREIITHLGLSDRVVLRGHVGSLREIWSGNHLLCAPAIDDGVPMTIPEAMLCSRPVLSTCVGGAEDWIEHGRTGYLCPAATVPLLAASLRAALADQTRWAELGLAARAAALARYRPDDYQSLIAPPHARLDS
ncbi:MAG: glycosyltransferase [Opitutaceae bacterium]|nr:glycosyltransferase [Opitutaceae bacterium]